MKNVFILPTDKPSRLQLNVNTKKLILFDNIQSNNESVHLTTQHIYITSDEEIKDVDYRLNIQRDYFKKSDKEGLDYYNKRNDVFKKIILTTDQELIKDGVQAIDDTFLEWFVKNPSCEVIKVNKLCYGALSGFADAGYKIIIPKEEPKQERMYSEEEVDALIHELINKFTDWSGSYVYNDKLIEIYKQFKKKEQ